MIEIKEKFIISKFNKQKILWFRTPKTGHMSLTQMFSNIEGYKHIERPVPFSRDKYSKWYKFAVAREPLERFRSIWKFMCLKKNYFGMGEEMYNINNCVDKIIESKNIHTIPQAELIPDDIDVEVFNYKFFNEMVRHLYWRYFDEPIPEISEIPKLNVSETVRYDALETKNIIKLRDYYSEDFRRFGYIFKRDIFSGQTR